MTLKSLIPIVALALLMTPSLIGAIPVHELDGDGSSGDPWQIADCEDLGAVRDIYDEGYYYYILVADVDYADCIDPDPGLGYPGFMPIGTLSEPFEGVFDGQGHKISNLFIWLPTGNFVGLFGVTGPDAEIYDLVLEDVDVTGNIRTGGLVGLNTGHIEGVTVSGRVSGRNLKILGGTGGLAGGSRLLEESEGSIIDCHSSADVSGAISVGGLVGFNEDLIIGCSATGRVTGVPSFPPDGDIDGITATEDDIVDELGSVFIGGLVGRNGGFGVLGSGSGLIAESFATGQVTGSFYTGGFVGANLADPEFIDDIRDELILGLAVQEAGAGDEAMPGDSLLAFFEEEQPGEVNDILDAELQNAAQLSAEEITELAGIEIPEIPADYLEGEGISTAAGEGYELPSEPLGIIVNSYSRGDVDAYAFSGGFAGWNMGLIELAYSTGSITGYAHIAGFAAWNDFEIIMAFSTGGVDAEAGMDCPSIGGFAGVNTFVLLGFYNHDASNPDWCIGTDEGLSLCLRIDDNEPYFFDVADTSEMYEFLWDFEDVWDTIFDDTCYPPLQWQGFTDADGDGYAADGGMCPSDCDDSLSSVNPGAKERCSNGRDDDCDGRKDCRDRDCSHHNDCEEGGGEVIGYTFTAGPSGQPPAPPAPPVGAPKIAVDSHATEGDTLQAIITDAEGDPATGEATVTKPDGTVIILPIVDGKVQIPLDQAGTWTITYVDSEGRTAMATIAVAGKAAEPMDNPPLRENIVAPEEPEVIEMVPAAVAGAPGFEWLHIFAVLAVAAGVLVLWRYRD